MGRRSNHYEAAFEQWLQVARLPHVVVDEQRRSLSPDGSLKSLDFIVSPAEGERLLIDVKGRRYPVSHRTSGQKWANWTPAEDLRALSEWEQIFGPGFRSLLVFAYDVLRPARYPALAPYYEFRGRHYSFFGVRTEAYRDLARTRSAAWETVHLPAAAFQELRFPLHELISLPTPEADWMTV